MDWMVWEVTFMYIQLSIFIKHFKIYTSKSNFRTFILAIAPIVVPMTIYNINLFCVNSVNVDNNKKRKEI